MISIRWNRLPAGVAAVLILLASASFAQQGARGSRMDDPKAVETIKGEVVSAEKVPSPGGKGYGVHLTLKTEKETLLVEVGPGGMSSSLSRSRQRTSSRSGVPVSCPRGNRRLSRRR